jgi:hypothetical protein
LQQQHITVIYITERFDDLLGIELEGAVKVAMGPTFVAVVGLLLATQASGWLP